MFLTGVPPGNAQYADTILLNGKIVTLDQKSAILEAIADTCFSGGQLMGMVQNIVRVVGFRT